MNANDIMKALLLVESIEKDIEDGYMTMEEVAEWNHLTKDELLQIHHRYLSMTVLNISK